MTRTESQAMKLDIEKVVYGGNGLAHIAEGTRAGTIFVPFTLPHEVIEARICKEHAGFAEAELKRIVQRSIDRVEPRCAHFGSCGGCHYQHGSYEAQLRLKKQILQETLERASLASLPNIDVHAAAPWEYRNRIRLRVAEVDRTLRVGYLRRASAEFLPVKMCPIAAPVLWRAAEALSTLAENSHHWITAVEEVEFFTSPDQHAVQMTVFVRREPKGFPTLCENLQQQLPELAGAGVAVMERETRGRKSLQIRAGSTWGKDGLSYIAGGESYWVSRGGFFQVNRHMIDRLLELVTHGRSGHLAWDLYAGVGLFSRALARSFNEVVAVESAAEDLMRTFRGKGRRAVATTTLDFLRQTVLQRERPELVVMDPPRAGVGAEACTLLARVQPKEIVYVSCDPVTLGRDLRVMVDSGYRLHELHMVDMFPQTFHQETVAVMRR
jgi:23S rRNA (uracil-5-)-methyltransferase RumA